MAKTYESPSEVSRAAKDTYWGRTSAGPCKVTKKDGTVTFERAKPSGQRPGNRSFNR